MSTIELAIDFGSSFITIFQRGRGLFLRNLLLPLRQKLRIK
jgi:hypothetical protein